MPVQSTALGRLETEATKTKTPESRKARFAAQNTTKSLQELTWEDDEAFSFIDGEQDAGMDKDVPIIDETHPCLHGDIFLDPEEEEEEEAAVLQCGEAPKPEWIPLVEVMRQVRLENAGDFTSSSSSESSANEVVVVESSTNAVALTQENSDTEELASDDTEIIPPSSGEKSASPQQARPASFSDGYLTDILPTTSGGEDGSETELVPTTSEEESEQRIVVVEGMQVVAERPALLQRLPAPVNTRQPALTPPPIQELLAPPEPQAKIHALPLHLQHQEDIKRMEDELVNALPQDKLSVRDIVHAVLGMMFPASNPPPALLPPPQTIDEPAIIEEEAVVPVENFVEQEIISAPPAPAPAPVLRSRRGRKRLVLCAEAFEPSLLWDDQASPLTALDLSAFIRLVRVKEEPVLFPQHGTRRRTRASKQVYPTHLLRVEPRRF